MLALALPVRAKDKTDPPYPYEAVFTGKKGPRWSSHVYLGTEYSNIYRESTQDGFFSQKKGTLDLEFDHRFANGDYFFRYTTHIGMRGAFGYKVDENGNPLDGDGGAMTPENIVKGTNNFSCSTDLAQMWRGANDDWAWGPVVGLCIAAYPTEQGDSSQDKFRSVPKAGVAFEWAFGEKTKLSSRNEIVFQKDPLFSNANRMVVMGRMTYHGLLDTFTVFIEGEINKSAWGDNKNVGRIGKDVGSIRLGIAFNLSSLFEGVGTMFKESKKTI